VSKCALIASFSNKGPQSTFKVMLLRHLLIWHAMLVVSLLQFLKDLVPTFVSKTQLLIDRWAICRPVSFCMSPHTLHFAGLFCRGSSPSMLRWKGIPVQKACCHCYSRSSFLFCYFCSCSSSCCCQCFMHDKVRASCGHWQSDWLSQWCDPANHGRDLPGDCISWTLMLQIELRQLNCHLKEEAKLDEPCACTECRP